MKPPKKILEYNNFLKELDEKQKEANKTKTNREDTLKRMLEKIKQEPQTDETRRKKINLVLELININLSNNETLLKSTTSPRKDESTKPTPIKKGIKQNRRGSINIHPLQIPPPLIFDNSFNHFSTRPSVFPTYSFSMDPHPQPLPQPYFFSFMPQANTNDNPNTFVYPPSETPTPTPPPILPPKIKKSVVINTKINNLSDLIELANTHPLKDDDPNVELEYNINMAAIHSIKKPLEKLNNMVGMVNLKTNIVDQILYFIQHLHKPIKKQHHDDVKNGSGIDINISDTYADPKTKINNESSSSQGPASTSSYKIPPQSQANQTLSSLFSAFIPGGSKEKEKTKYKKTNKGGDFMHTVIYGPPGTGKTEVAKIIARIYCKLGVLSTGAFKKVTRSDLVAGYLGQTALKTKDVIKECLGGVLFIDEAYSLGNEEKRDSFSKECIDTLCEALSDYKEDFMVIIAGYEKELNECFFNYNQGLDSRFVWRFKTDDYTAEELYKIFCKKVEDIGWKIQITPAPIKWFSKQMPYFKYYGRDMETLLAKCKISHSKRVFCKPEEEKRILIMEDLEKGLELYLNNDEIKKRKENETLQKMLSTIYV